MQDGLSGVASQDHSDLKNSPQDAQVLVFRLSGPQGLGFYWESPGAVSVPSASEAEEGKTRQTTAQQIMDGAAGNLFATVARLKAELDRRMLVAADAYAEVRRTTAQSVPNNSFQDLSFNTVDRDPRGWRTSATVMTVGATGLYLFNADGSWGANATNSRVVRFDVNSGARQFGTERRQGFGTSDFSVTGVAWLTAGDAVKAQVYQNSGGALSIAAGVRVTATRLK